MSFSKPFSNKSEPVSLLEDLYSQPSGPNLSSAVTVGSKLRGIWNNDEKAIRLLSGGILFLGFLGLIVGVAQVRGHVFGPLEARLAAARDATELLLAQPVTPPDLLGLSGLDTDNDGLSDYDEQELYGTSRYLEDTDSDGKTDKEEIAKNTDPNCAYERDCPLTRVATGAAASTLTLPGGNPLDILGGNATPAQIRDLLVQSGTPRAQVDALTDDELLAVYREILSEAKLGATDRLDGVVGDEPLDTASAVGGLSFSPDQLRQLLRNYGMSEADLSQVSDEDLQALAQQTLAEQSGGSAPAPVTTSPTSLSSPEPLPDDGSTIITGEQTILP